jgi:hypothetical protein
MSVLCLFSLHEITKQNRNAELEKCRQIWIVHVYNAEADSPTL